MGKQEDIFLSFEGDNWFERNKEALTKRDDLVVFLLDLYRIKPSRVLEIGCSNGYRLARLKEKYGCEVIGVEPSEKAIEDGRSKFPGVEFVRGTAEDMDFQEGLFDLIILKSVMHWIDRDVLLKSVANIDRSLARNGLLVIGDFQTPYPIKRRYHHLKDMEVYTYKLSYRNIFLSTGGYIEIAFLSMDHDTHTLSVDAEMDRYYGLALLKKKEIYVNR